MFSLPVSAQEVAEAVGSEAPLKVVGAATPWQIGFQEGVTPVMKQLSWLHDIFLLSIITGITLFVLALTFIIVVRFNRRANPTPSTVTHNTLLEVVWTVIPVIILIAIAIPSLRMHYLMDREPEAEMVLKVTGRQWYWSYEYPDQGGFGFDSYLIKDDELKEGQLRLLEVDNRVVVPVDTVVKVQMTSSDVIHAWSIPAFGVKRDAVPGRLNESWFKAEKEGVYYGQCSELCGVGHGFMPIAVEVVSKERFDRWVRKQRVEAGLPEVEPEVKPEEASDETQDETGAETAAEASGELKPEDKPQPQNIPQDEQQPIAQETQEQQPVTPAETKTSPAPVDAEDVKSEDSASEAE